LKNDILGGLIKLPEYEKELIEDWGSIVISAQPMRIGSIIPKMVWRGHLKPLLYLKNYKRRDGGNDKPRF